MSGRNPTLTAPERSPTQLSDDERRWLRRKVDDALAGDATAYWKFVGLVVLACMVITFLALAIGLQPFGLRL